MIRSPQFVGHKAGGRALLRKGDNEVDDSKLTRSERALIQALLKAKVVEDLGPPKPPPEPEPAESGTRLAEDDPKPKVKRRRASGK